MSTIDKQRNYGRQEARAPRLCVRQRRLDAPDQRRGPSSSDHGCAARPTGDLEDCTEGSDQEHELAAITDAIEAYEAVRWPGKISGGAKVSR
jgi:hypothetical protein